MTVIVTGATSFIGRAVVKALLEEGCRVVAVSRPASAGAGKLQELFEDLKKQAGAEKKVFGSLELCFCELGEIEKLEKIYNKEELQAKAWLHLGWDGAGSDKRKDVKLPGVEKVTAVTKEEALERFKERLGEQQNLLNSLGTDNPFPYYFEVEVDAPERIAELTPQIGEMEGVETAKFGQEVVEQLFQITKILRIGGILLVVLLAFATLFIIANTIRLTVFARRREVNIMKYVGATDWFIRWPFMLEGMTLGFFGSLISITIIDISYSALLSRIYSTLAFLPMLPPYPMLIYVDLFIIISGTAIGAAGSYVSLRKFLRV